MRKESGFSILAQRQENQVHEIEADGCAKNY